MNRKEMAMNPTYWKGVEMFPSPPQGTDPFWYWSSEVPLSERSRIETCILQILPVTKSYHRRDDVFDSRTGLILKSKVNIYYVVRAPGNTRSVYVRCAVSESFSLASVIWFTYSRDDWTLLSHYVQSPHLR